MNRGAMGILVLGLWCLICSNLSLFRGVQGIGVNYGMLGNNLPAPDQVVSLYKLRNIKSLRIFDPNPNALDALRGSGIAVILGTYNEDLEKLASNESYAAMWVQTNVASFAGSVKFKYINAGNEVIPGELAKFVLPAMKNLDSAVKEAGFSIPVSTAVSTEVLGVSYPPSQGAFSESSSSYMDEIVSYLQSKNCPLLINVYPYFAYSLNPKEIHLDYALFNTKQNIVTDGSIGYTNLFDAIVDSVYAAMEKSGGSDVDLVVSETGWPSRGGTGATVENARIYNNNVIQHVKNGTPRRPGKEVETYLFALFNENQKPQGVEQNFGLYEPDMSEVYHVDFSG